MIEQRKHHDFELAAIAKSSAALEELSDGAARRRVLTYVMNRYLQETGADRRQIATISEATPAVPGMRAQEIVDLLGQVLEHGAGGATAARAGADRFPVVFAVAYAAMAGAVMAAARGDLNGVLAATEAVRATERLVESMRAGRRPARDTARETTRATSRSLRSLAPHVSSLTYAWWRVAQSPRRHSTGLSP